MSTNSKNLVQVSFVHSQIFGGIHVCQIFNNFYTGTSHVISRVT